MGWFGLCRAFEGRTAEAWAAWGRERQDRAKELGAEVRDLCSQKIIAMKCLVETAGERRAACKQRDQVREHRDELMAENDRLRAAVRELTGCTDPACTGEDACERVCGKPAPPANYEPCGEFDDLRVGIASTHNVGLKCVLHEIDPDGSGRINFTYTGHIYR